MPMSYNSLIHKNGGDSSDAAMTMMATVIHGLLSTLCCRTLVSHANWTSALLWSSSANVIHKHTKKTGWLNGKYEDDGKGKAKNERMRSCALHVFGANCCSRIYLYMYLHLDQNRHTHTQPDLHERVAPNIFWKVWSPLIFQDFYFTICPVASLHIGKRLL